ncbi:DNA protecting protein DprA [Alkalihalophilus pseudofirmus OF4]|uniref:DNA protecting protein DprA n=1 Tax=Alkalihalophilus pseudofirmus (strain ATCC BAA-2126 / JCM 17055 / OF4) TaxID=398511 RepID=D3FT50_ALKPO|nr:MULTISPECIES: DNA-processing protein DprA [Alkalihalophilus]ADC48118.1 DNA protecting protein DprA [Alkalihalophilus pseudofirmus OF4]MED1602275.1 DNA-processing protein DprA [Alkalihalophilus marmarensis]
MNTFRERLIVLHSSMFLSWKQIAALINHDPELLTPFTSSSAFFIKHLHLKRDKAVKLVTYLKEVNSREYVSKLATSQITTLTRFDADYPEQLKELYDPPWVLYCKGDIDLLLIKIKLAVVGSRTPTNRGLGAVANLVKPLVKENVCIVSGLALGIDTAAHQQTISQNGHTIAVLGSGFHHFYPKENKNLFTYMAAHQLVISEYPPHQPPAKWTFPARNRIISGLSKGVLVIEAKERSGSLITADQALDQNRDVFAVPGPIDSELSKGTNQLIKEGAKLVVEMSDILNEWT